MARDSEETFCSNQRQMREQAKFWKINKND